MTPFAIAGDENPIAPAFVGGAAIRSAEQVFGVPVQLRFPAASKANSSLPAAIHTVPATTAGDDKVSDGNGAVHNGVQVLVAPVPEQCPPPVASIAKRAGVPEPDVLLAM